MIHGKTVDDMKFMLECLKRRSLLETFGERDFDFRMHDLWREFAAAEMKVEEFANRRWISKSKGCNGKVDLTEFPKMEVVKLVDVWDDVALDVRGLKHLKSLEVIPIKFGDDYFNTQRDTEVEVNGLGTLVNLLFLRCDFVASSASITELGCLTELQVVVLRRFKGDKLPDMSKSTSLRKLDLRWSTSLRSIHLEKLTNLTHLDLYGCIMLRNMNISGCKSMKELWDFYATFDLEDLNISACPLLPSLKGLFRLRKLRRLDITGCSSIRAVNDLTRLVALEEFRAAKCQNLAVLPDVSKLTNLRILDIEPTKVPVRVGCQGLPLQEGF